MDGYEKHVLQVQFYDATEWLFSKVAFEISSQERARVMGNNSMLCFFFFFFVAEFAVHYKTKHFVYRL